MPNSVKAALALILYVATIVMANVATAHWGLVPVGFGLVVTAGTYFAGFALLARDIVQEAAGVVLVLGGIAVGGLLSWVMATPQLAIASALAFGLAEVADLAVYTPLRGHGFSRAAMASNIVGAVVDTFVFLWVAGFPITVNVVTGQLVGKLLWATLVPLLLIALVRRAVLRQPLRST
jgi:uncharacterized PurR-regulated membrane protein YhhQ (DUF165 family)